VQVEIGQQLEDLSRAGIIAQSLKNQGGIVLTADLDEACQLASDFAAEHTCIATANPAAYVDKIPNAGGLFIGERSFEVLGDYVAGPSHVMPTSSTARFASPLNVLDFVKITSIIQLDDATSARLSPIAAQIAQAEGLTAHANAARREVNRGGRGGEKLKEKLEGKVIREPLRSEDKITEKVIGAAIEVHRHLGPGLLESAYQGCLAHEMALRGIRFEREKVVPVCL
jgi:hypothetical protein